ncbi:heterokaryon incompatibility protein-domain-containing protein [Boeremia exigua]|uniref:heterokaryon incompatibility protein-domain-containing protein n=1 Tax=Boeremia exigua TaxID=749465 RepID=UPI001E8DC938|nr:heterokaryon incompatibility protein-domain-containing protein [Boeremia exigua]KAH6625173.1 heterokaryon incompatibility protein-domain-containing protein [Boeremia exigua]
MPLSVSGDTQLQVGDTQLPNLQPHTSTENMSWLHRKLGATPAMVAGGSRSLWTQLSQVNGARADAQEAGKPITTQKDQPLMNQSKVIELTGPEICDRCSAIDWESLMHVDERYQIIVSESLHELHQSQCRICQLLGYFFLQNTIASTKRISLPTSSNTFPGPHLIKGVDIYITSGHAWAYSATTRLLVSKTHPYDPLGSTGLDNLYPPSISLGQIKAWIVHCRDQHGHRCSPNPQHDLKKLQMIDCNRKEVVSAPKRCRTILDAIKITKDLGYQYLWVDRYCIAQDSAEIRHVQIAQMGDIYDAADLTIIAAIGHDPNYGLPGVSTRLRAVRFARIDSSYVTVLPIGNDVTKITSSAWSTRGWTLQEGILSRRRLILTDRQAVFVCNTNTRFEIEADDRSPFVQPENTGWLARQEGQDPMLTAMMHLETYSTRTLSYDVDALNAILGALNTLRKEGIYHLWGVPYAGPRNLSRLVTVFNPCSRTLSCTTEHGNGVALMWYHTGKARRRHGFPSWSPIGWEGAIKCAKVPMSNLRHVASCCGVDIQTGTRRQSLLTHRPSYDAGSDASQQLYLHGETYASPMVSIEGVAIPFNSQIYYICPVNWSVPPSHQSESLPRIKVLLIRDRRQNAYFSSDQMIVLRPCETGQGRRFERIGYANYQPRVPVSNLDRRWVDNDMKPLDSATDFFRGEHATSGEDIDSQTWWRHCFRPEVVAVV